MKPTIIIGGGIVGLFTAYFLHKSGVEVIIVDKGYICKTDHANFNIYRDFLILLCEIETDSFIASIILVVLAIPRPTML